MDKTTIRHCDDPRRDGYDGDEQLPVRSMLARKEIRAIYDRGLNAVAVTIRQLYDMIEMDDERVQRLVALATAAHLQRIEQLVLL